MASKTIGFFHDKKEISKLKDLESVISGTMMIVFQPSLAESAECRNILMSVYCLVVNKTMQSSVFQLWSVWYIPHKQSLITNWPEISRCESLCPIPALKSCKTAYIFRTCTRARCWSMSLSLFFLFPGLTAIVFTWWDVPSLIWPVNIFQS